MSKRCANVGVSRKKSLLTGLILILLLSTYELVEDGFQYNLTSISLELVHASPYFPSTELSDRERVIEESRETIRLHILVHLALVVIASGCLLCAVRKGDGPEHDVKEESERVSS